MSTQYRTAIILANGILSNPDSVRARLESLGGHACVVAADGGSQHAARLGVHIDVVIGDMDSISAQQHASLQEQGVDIRQFPRSKDETDLELALLFAAEKGIEQVVIIGALGGRLDMSIANVLLLTHPALDDMRIELWEGDQTAWLIVPPGDVIHGSSGDTLSLIPLGGDALGVTSENLKYPLVDEALVFGPARGVSNVLMADTARISLQNGLLLATHIPGSQPDVETGA